MWCVSWSNGGELVELFVYGHWGFFHQTSECQVICGMVLLCEKNNINICRAEWWQVCKCITGRSYSSTYMCEVVSSAGVLLFLVARVVVWWNLHSIVSPNTLHY